MSSESDLIAGLRVGDESAFRYLVRRHGPRMRAVALRILRNEEDALDAIQDSLVAVSRAIHGFSARAQLTTWLHRVVVNACLMRLRSAQRRREVLHGLDLADLSANTLPLSTAPVGDEEVRVIRQCFVALPRKYREVLLLRHVCDLSSDETAQILMTTPNAVNIRAFRARKALLQGFLAVTGEGAPARFE